MPAYSGRFQYLDEGGKAQQPAPCEASFDEETCTLTASSGEPVVFDLGDVDRASPGTWDITLDLYTGRRIVLSHFGPAFDRFAAELLEAWRNRTVRCMLLEDLEEVARFNGVAAGAPAEIRIYGSNLAVLPLGASPVQWRLAEVDAISFDEATYQVTILRGAERLPIGKLAKKTEEFVERLRATHEKLRREAGEVLHRTFPFLNADRLRRLASAVPEGRSVRLADLAEIDPKLPDALVARAVDPPLKPYFDFLLGKTVPGSLMAGFKFVRPDEAGENAEEAGATSEEEPQPLFFWFFFPLAGKNVAAWEATTGTGRATYFFRAAAPVEAAIAGLTRGLALVNFRREPVYLPGESLERQPKFHRYAIGCRKLPDLRTLREAFLGRAIHSSVEEWQQQVSALGG